MARVLCVVESPVYTRIVTDFVRGLGHQVLSASAPFDTEALNQFHPDAAVVTIDRRHGAMGDPIEDREVDLGGLRSLHAFLDTRRLIGNMGVVVLGVGLTPSDLPFELKDVEFAAFSPDLAELQEDLERELQNS